MFIFGHLTKQSLRDDPNNPLMDSLVESASDAEDETGVADKGSPSSEGNGGSMTDEELFDILDDLQTNVTVVGCGGGGSNTITRMAEEGIHGARLVALNTDAQHLVETKCDEKILIGKKKTGGRGAGSVPQVGEESARENSTDIENTVTDADMVFVTAGMGGGTGTGSAPVVAEKAKEAGALTVAVVTLPFTAEGEQRRINAEAGIKQLRQAADTVIVIPNDRLLDTVGEMPVKKAFKIADEVLMRSVKGITEMITKPGLVNLDFADVRTIMENGGVAMIGLGESESESKAQDSVSQALSSPLLDVDISRANAALVNVTGGPDMTIDEAEGVVEDLYDRVDPDARIIWGTGIDESFEGKMSSLLVVTGVDSEQIYGNPSENTAMDKNEIDFVA